MSDVQNQHSERMTVTVSSLRDELLKLIQERNELKEQLERADRVAATFNESALICEEENKRLLEQLEAAHFVLGEIAEFIQGRHKEGDTEYQATILARSVLNPATESALYDAPEPIQRADGAAGKPGADSVPASSPQGNDLWAAWNRCPICEGIDQPGLIHQPAAPYCSMGVEEQSPAKERP